MGHPEAGPKEATRSGGRGHALGRVLHRWGFNIPGAHYCQADRKSNGTLKSDQTLLLLMVKVVNRDFAEQTAIDSSAFTSVFNSIWAHVYDSVAKSSSFQARRCISAKPGKYANARHSINDNPAHKISPQS